MKKVFTLSILIIFISISSVFSQVPQKISYTGVLTDINGVALNGNYNIQFSLWNSETSGIALWQETQVVSVNNGIFDVYLGAVNPVTLPFDIQYWLEIEIEGSLLLPRIMLVSSPYSFISNNVIDNAITSDKIANGTIQAEDLNQMGAVAGNVLSWDGFSWLPVELSEIVETDPIFTNSAAYEIDYEHIDNWNTAYSQGIEAYSWGNHAEAGYLTSFEETDPVFSNSFANLITGDDITNWNTAFAQGTEAYSWGNHANMGYLTEFTEIDPVFTASPAYYVTYDNFDYWNTAYLQGSAAYSWGNHADYGYLTSFTESDPLFTSSWASMITGNDISNWNTAFAQGSEAYSWGNHADYGYLTSFTEIDPLFSSSWASLITGDDISNWNTAFAQGSEAYSWGNHADYGYLTSFTEIDPLFSSSWASMITGDDISNWNTAFAQGSEAYSWGNHADYGYLTSFTEIDPLFSSSWAAMITGDDISNWNTAFAQGSEAYSWGNHADYGYLTSFTEIDPLFSNSVAFNILDVDILNWNDAYNFGAMAYSWGNHADMGYLVGESDPVFWNSPAANITDSDRENWYAAFDWGNHALYGYMHSTDPYVQSLNSLTGEVNIVAGANITVQESDNNIIISSTGGGGLTFPYLANPSCETDAFTVMNSGSGGSVAGLSSNNNVGRLGSYNYGVVGVNGTNGNFGALGASSAGVKASSNNGIETYLAYGATHGLKSYNPNTGLEVSLAGSHGLAASNSLFNNSFAGVGYVLFGDYYGFWSDNFTNGTDNATQIVLTGNDFVLYGSNGNSRSIYLASETEGLYTAHFPPSLTESDCYVKLTLDDPSNPGYAYPLYMYKKIDDNNRWTVSSGQSYALYASHYSSVTGYTSARFCQYASQAATFNGNVDVVGNLSKLGGSFKIDHPQDPENKYLVHSFVESPDMMNVYNGNIILDDNGEAIIDLPDYFEALNKDFRYQLTCIGGFANIYIKEKVKNNKFKISGGTAGLEVSWQVTGIRKDPWAEKNRIQTEPEKADKDKGKYLTPDVYNQPKEKGIYFESNNLQLEKK